MQYVPQRETGMTPYEIMLSESQERMLLVAEKGREDEVFARVPQVGSRCGHHRRRHRYRPTGREGSRDRRRRHSEPRTRERSAAVRPAAYEAAIERHRWKRRTFQSSDLNARSRDAAQPRAIFAPSAGSSSSTTGACGRTRRSGRDQTRRSSASKKPEPSVAMSLDGNGRYCYLDPREGTKLIVAECCRNLSTVGALPVATTNNLNFGNPERPEIMAQLVESIEGMAEACEFFDVPVTGGNVSLYNETLGDAIFPTPVVGIVGLLETAQPVRSPLSATPGRAIILLGGPGRVRRSPFRRHPIRQVRHPIPVGSAARARYGSGKAGPGSHASGDRRRIWPSRLTILAMADWR